MYIQTPTYKYSRHEPESPWKCVHVVGSMCACPEPDMKKVKVIKMRNLTRIRSLSLDNQQLQLHECVKVYWNSKYVNLNTRVVLKYTNKKVLRKNNTILLFVTNIVQYLIHNA